MNIDDGKEMLVVEWNYVFGFMGSAFCKFLGNKVTREVEILDVKEILLVGRKLLCGKENFYWEWFFLN